MRSEEICQILNEAAFSTVNRHQRSSTRILHVNKIGQIKTIAVQY